MERHRAVQCRPSRLNPPNLELGSSEQGKYEEEKREKQPNCRQLVGNLYLQIRQGGKWMPRFSGAKKPVNPGIKSVRLGPASTKLLALPL